MTTIEERVHNYLMPVTMGAITVVMVCLAVGVLYLTVKFVILGRPCQ